MKLYYDELNELRRKFTKDRGRKNAYQTISVKKKKKFFLFKFLGENVRKLEYNHFPSYETLL